MEMVQTEIIMRKFISLACLALLLSATVSAQTFKWHSVPMDGTRTGTSMPGQTDAAEKLGVVEGNVYHAPNGRDFKGGTATAAAALMLEAQASVSPLKESIGWCPQKMTAHRPESGLSNMIVDCMVEFTEKETGRHIDVGLINFGGIRESMPEGNVELGDIFSMLPFLNYLNIVELKGVDLRRMLLSMSGDVQALSGVRMEITGGKITSLLVGGERIDNDRIYNLVTVDFLLAGGDGISAAGNAISVYDTKVLVRDAFLSCLKDLRESGRDIEYPTDGRVKFIR